MYRQDSNIFILSSIDKNSRYPADKNSAGRCLITSPYSNMEKRRRKKKEGDALVDDTWPVDFSLPVLYMACSLALPANAKTMPENPLWQHLQSSVGLAPGSGCRRWRQPVPACTSSGKGLLRRFPELSSDVSCSSGVWSDLEALQLKKKQRKKNMGMTYFGGLLLF